MRAAAFTEYGGPEVLTVHDDLPEPLVGPDAVLVRVRAAGVNPVDGKIRGGYLDGAFPSAFPIIAGWDVAGVVERTGPGVTEFVPGDEVIGYVRKDHVQHGTYAELVAAPVRTLAAKPSALSFAEAAALPLAALTAHQALDAIDIDEGDTVLIHAASGGVGAFAVQLAVLRGARVIGTASEGNHDFLRELGAEPLAYGEGLPERVRALAPEGVASAVDLAGGVALDQSFDLVGDPAKVVSVIDGPGVLARGGRYVFVRPDATMLDGLSRLADKGDLRVFLARTFPLAEAAAAQALVDEGHVRGKVAIEV